jgi:acyl dehydratase
MTIDRSRIGFATAPTRVPIDAWRVKLFCQAIGETDAVHWDVAAARAAGHAACPVPPTFLKAIEGEHFSSAALMQLLRVPLTGVLHAEQRFDHLAPVHVGDVVEVTRRVERIDDKKNGALTFIVVDTDYRVGDRAAARSTQTILVRNSLAA